MEIVHPVDEILKGRGRNVQFPQFVVGSILLHKHLRAVLLPTVQQNCSAVGTIPFQKVICKGLPPTTNCGK
jgi:hypothetical protein